MRAVQAGELIGRALVTAERLVRTAAHSGLVVVELRMSQETVDGIAAYVAGMLTKNTGFPYEASRQRGATGMRLYGTPVEVDADMLLGQVMACVVLEREGDAKP